MQEKNERQCTGIFVYRFNETTSEYEVALVQTNKFRHYDTQELLWTIPGGKIEPKDAGDTLEKRILACAQREVRQEIGIEIENVTYYPHWNSQKTGAEIGVINETGDINRTTQFYFYECVARALSDELTHGDDVIRTGWYSLSQIQSLNMAKDVKGLLQDILTHTEKYFVK